MIKVMLENGKFGGIRAKDIIWIEEHERLELCKLTFTQESGISPFFVKDSIDDLIDKISMAE